MRFSRLPVPAAFVGLALLAGAATLPTLANQPTGFEAVKPLLIAQDSAVERDSASAENPASLDAAVVSGPGAATRSSVREFLDSQPAGSTIKLTLPVKDFIYENGGVGNPNGSTNINIFNSFFKKEYGVLGGANSTVLRGPLTARATSAFSPNLTQADLNKLKSVTVKFDYAFPKRPPDALDLIIRNVTTGQTTCDTSLPLTSGKSFTLDIKDITTDAKDLKVKKCFPAPGVYALRSKSVKPGSTNDDAVGFYNVTVTIVRK